mmetsp:Transcript_10846/g.30292  ORF Transcript_10846/g.30292 Transcript_10846/m.30292 type:complete len:83 (+) Transcript_10846:1983-2231(+)
MPPSMTSFLAASVDSFAPTTDQDVARYIQRKNRDSERASGSRGREHGALSGLDIPAKWKPRRLHAPASLDSDCNSDRQCFTM